MVAGERQLNLFQEWVQGAQDIPKEDKVLSVMWEELLVKILKGIDFEGQLMRALSRLSESDAVLLLKFSRTSKYRPKSRKERYKIEQPQFYNLVETSSISNGINITIGILCFLSFSSLLYFDAKDLMQSNFDTVAAATASAYGLLYRLLPKFGLIAGVGGVLALTAWRFIPSHQLTWFGFELLKQARVSNDEIQIIENQA